MWLFICEGLQHQLFDIICTKKGKKLSCVDMFVRLRVCPHCMPIYVAGPCARCEMATVY